MNRVLFALLALFAISAKADGTLKCYMCSSLTNSACEDPSKDSTLPLVECDTRALTSWHTEMQKNVVFQNFAHLFEVDQPQHFTKWANPACAKMNLKVGNQKVTLRSCQTAKTPTLDPCNAIKSKLATNSAGSAVVMDYCDLCESEGCNGAVGIAPPKIFQLLIGSVGLMLFQAFRNCFA